MESVRGAPESYPALTAAERLVVCCARPRRRSVRMLRDVVSAVASEGAWDEARLLLGRHRLNGYAWYHLERIASELDAAFAEETRYLHYKAIDADFRASLVLEEVSARLTAARVPFAFVKGPLLHQSLYADRGNCRDSEDLDVMIFGGRARTEEAIVALEGSGFTLDPRRGLPWSPTPRSADWPAAYDLRHDLPMSRDVAGTTALVELLRAPADFWLDGEEAERLVAWLERQRARVAWRSCSPTGPSEVEGLTPTGCLVYLAINLLKEGIPSIRNVHDLAALLVRHGDRIDWSAVKALASRGSLRGIVDVALLLGMQWRGERIGRYAARVGPLLARQRLASSFFTVPSLLRWPLQDLSSKEEYLRRCVFVGALFGRSAVENLLRRSERHRKHYHPTASTRLPYALVWPAELPGRLVELVPIGFRAARSFRP